MTARSPRGQRSRARPPTTNAGQAEGVVLVVAVAGVEPAGGVCHRGAATQPSTAVSGSISVWGPFGMRPKVAFSPSRR